MSWFSTDQKKMSWFSPLAVSLGPTSALLILVHHQGKFGNYGNHKACGL